MLSRLPKKFLGIGAVIIIALVVSTIAALQSGGQKNTSQNQKQPQGQVVSNPLSPINAVSIGKTTTKTLDTLRGVVKKDDATYLVPQDNLVRTDEVIVKNNVAVFKRTRLPTSPEYQGYTTVKDIRGQYGEPDKTIQGSRHYGEAATTYIYSKKGLAFIGNANTNEVFEKQEFQTMSVEQYLNLYGDDIQEESNSLPHKE